MKIYVARHGETTWNIEKRILGHTPGELTKVGREQACELAEHLATVGLTKIYSSDLKRAVETSRIVNKLSPRAEVVLTPGLRERNFGELEGKLMSQVDWDGLWAAPDSKSLYGAESLADFTARIAHFTLKLRDSDSERETIGIICHIGTMNRFNYLSDPAHFHFINYPNADATEFDLDVLAKNSEQYLAKQHIH